jgi:hypothetical protein
MKKIIALVGFLLGFVTSAQAALSKGFGFGVAQSTNGTEGVLIWQSNRLEVNLQVGNHSETVIDQNGNNAQVGDLGLTARLGMRFDVGNFNFVAVCGQFYTTVLAKDQDITSLAVVNRPFEYQAGPYIAFQRPFHGSNLMISAWILPVMFSSQYQKNWFFGTAAISSATYWIHWGGVQISYLF